MRVFKNESGRSLIEILGVMAIGAIMVISALTLFQAVQRQQRQMTATDDLRTLSDSIKILFAGRGNYSGISTSYLIKAGAIRSEKNQISDSMIATSETNGSRYAIEYEQVRYSDCAYFAIAKMDFVDEVRINGYAAGKELYCNRSGNTNKVKFFFR